MTQNRYPRLSALSGGLNHFFAVSICLFLLSSPLVGQKGTASLTGKVQDITGAAISGAQAELRSESDPDEITRIKTDDTGTYRFSGLSSGEFALRLFRPGFRSLTVKFHIADGEQKMLPVLELAVSMGDDGGIESAYQPLYMERCPAGNCDPRLRPKRPLVICE